MTASTLPFIDGLAGNRTLAVLKNRGDSLTKGLHRHPHGEFFFLRAGYIKSQSDAGHWLIPPGHLCWIPPLAAHAGLTENTRYIRIHLSAELCSELPSGFGLVACTPLMIAVVDRLAELETICGLLSVSEMRLIEVLIEEFGRSRRTPIVLPMPRDPVLRSIAERWLSQPQALADLDGLSTDAGISRRSFTRKFRAETGLSIGKWRQVARLIRGVEMLATGKTVTDTAFSLGYDSISSFVVLCQRHTGMSPSVLASAITGSPPADD